MKGVHAYQCSWIDTAAKTLIVVLNIAADDASYASIRGGDDRYDGAKRVELGDAAWIYVKDGDLTVRVHRNRTVLDLRLASADLGQSKALIDLTRVVLKRIE